LPRCASRFVLVKNDLLPLRMATLKDDATQYGKKLEGKLESPESCEYKTMHCKLESSAACSLPPALSR